MVLGNLKRNRKTWKKALGDVKERECHVDGRKNTNNISAELGTLKLHVKEPSDTGRQRWEKKKCQFSENET